MYESITGNIYETRAAGKILIVQETRPDGSFTKKNVKVVFDNDCLWKLQKTQIRAIHAAEGLKTYLDGFSKWTDFGSCYPEKVYKWIMCEMKEAK